MNTKEYQQETKRTANSGNIHPPGAATGSDISIAGETDLLHAAIGICTEAGEFMDAIKRRFFYGKSLDPVNLVEELGDLLWYISLAANALGIPIEAIMQKNIDKLKARYPEKWTREAALNRDLDAERKVLEAPIEKSIDVA